MSVSAISASASRESYYEAPDGTRFQLQEGRFRVNRKSVGLTYAAPTDREENPIASNEMLLAELNKTCTPPERYMIGMELHPSNNKLHYHVYIEWDYKVDIKNERHFDVAGVHPNIISVKSKKKWMRYCSKEGNTLTNFSTCPWKRALQASSDAEAMDILWDEKPMDMAKHGHMIEKNIKKRRYQPPEPIVYCGPFGNNFQIPREVFEKNLALIVRGESGIGKTQWARYVASHTWGDYLYVKGSLQGLRNYQGEKCIIFDDLTIHGDDVMKYNALMDVESGGTVRVLYGSVDIPPGVYRIFLTNDALEGGLLVPDIPALRRRYMEVQVK